ncbi:MAG: CapA family protein [Erysipelotrichales bacterium]
MKRKIILSTLLAIILIGGILLYLNLNNNIFVGKDMSEAKKYAEDHNYTLKINEKYSDSPYFEVISENKKSNNEYQINISKGIDYNGKTESDLKAITKDKSVADFKLLKNKEQMNKDIEKGKILEYDINLDKKEISYAISLGSDPITTKLKLAAVGDILIHDTIYNDAKVSGTYDFKPIFKDIKKQFSGHDLIYANQESLAGGAKLGLSSYPTFNSPHQITDALDYLGVNMISRANNHTLDAGEKGVLSASKYYKRFDNIITAGSYSSQKERDKISIIEKKGIKVGLLSYTYGFNGFQLPEKKEYLGNLFSNEQAKRDIDKAKKQADVVVVAMHWGNEYEPLPNLEQKKQAKFLNQQGVDIILGSHPHVLEPVDFIKNKETKQETFVIYSLGNFLSAQDKRERLTGLILSLDIDVTKSLDGTKVKVSNGKMMPTYNYANNGIRDYSIVPLIVFKG